jgi:hypothetical protein
MTVRLGAVTKRGHAEAIFDGFGPFWGWFSLLDLLLVDWLTLVTEFIGMTSALAIFGVPAERPLLDLGKVGHGVLRRQSDLHPRGLHGSSRRFDCSSAGSYSQFPWRVHRRIVLFPDGEHRHHDRALDALLPAVIGGRQGTDQGQRRGPTSERESGFVGDPKWTDGELLDFMMQLPILINRPIVVTPKGVRLCRPSEAVLDILPSPVSRFVKEDGGGVEALARKG